ERARSGKLRIELSAAQNMQGQAALVAVISNVGKEPVVLRDIGYAKRRLLGQEFIPVTPPDAQLPFALNARDLIQITVPDDLDELYPLANHFQVKDSMGKLWDASDTETRKAQRQLRTLETAQLRGQMGSRESSDQAISQN